jgi:hypothetical protein
MFRRIVAAAAGAVLLAGIGVAATWNPAQATTGTCLGTQNPVSGPVSCGGLFLPGMGSGTQPNGTSLTLTANADFWNAPITFSLYSASAKTQDFKLFERCNVTVGPVATRTEANPCGTGSTPVLNAASGKPEFVAEVAPLGTHIGGVINSPSNLCISEEGVHDGPRHHLRWHMVERTCNTFGAVFTEGIADGIFPSPPFANTGVVGTVVSPNPWQTFAAVPGNGGDLIANDILSNNFHNTLFVVDDRAGGYPAGTAIVYPENDGPNQVAEFIGCNGAVITTGVSFNCP